MVVDHPRQARPAFCHLSFSHSRIAVVVCHFLESQSQSHHNFQTSRARLNAAKQNPLPSTILIIITLIIIIIIIIIIINRTRASSNASQQMSTLCHQRS